MRTSIRVLITVSIAAVLTGVGYLMGAAYVIFHLVVIEGGLAAGGHAISSSFDGLAVIKGGTAIGAALGIAAALYFWHHSKPG